MKRSLKQNLKQIFHQIHSYLPWLLLLLGLDAFGALLLWLVNAPAFRSLFAVIVLATLLLFMAISFVLIDRERKREQLFSDFLENPDPRQEELLIRAVSPSQKASVRLLGSVLRDRQQTYDKLKNQLDDYEEYVESWAHEIKTPLSLLAFLLDNRREELPDSVCFRLEFIQNHLQQSVDQMLFYARLKSPRKDYLFESVSIRTCMEDVLEDYKPLLEEKQFQIHLCLPDERVYSDRRSLRFLLGQLISNAIKYCSHEPQLDISFFQTGSNWVLRIQDNGIGVPACDLPYILEKGFTGNSGDGRKKATGMGLYLAKEIAGDLNLTLQANSKWNEGFTMEITFPIIPLP